MGSARSRTAAVAAVLGAVALLLVLATWSASIGQERVVSGGHVDVISDNQPDDDKPIFDDDPPDGDADRAPGEPTGVLRGVAVLLQVALVGVALYALARLLRGVPVRWRSRVRRRRRRREPEPDFVVLDTPARVADEIAAGAAEQRDVLMTATEPRNAVVECWQRFEEQAVRGGAVRHPWQTTAEFVLAVLDLVGADRGAVTRLADIYREARFSDHPVTEEHRRAALEALDAVHASLPARAVAR